MTMTTATGAGIALRELAKSYGHVRAVRSIDLAAHRAGQGWRLGAADADNAVAGIDRRDGEGGQRLPAAVPALVLLFLAGASLGVHLRATQWLEMTGVLPVGLAPFVVMGCILGYLLRSDAAVPAVGGLVVLFALFGGVFGFQLATSGPLFEVMKAMPSYWLVQAGKTAIGSGGWPAEAWIVLVIWTVLLVPIAAVAFRRSAARA